MKRVLGLVFSALLVASAFSFGCSSDSDSNAPAGAAGSGAAGSGAAGSGAAGSGAAGSGAADSGAADSGGSGTGVTACGEFGGKAVSCIAGQYCEDQVLSKCSDGCLSNVNCAADQECKKTTGNTGTCQNKTTTPTKDCAAFATKAKACGMTKTDAELQQACIALSEACISCLIKENCTSQACSTLCGMDL